MDILYRFEVVGGPFDGAPHLAWVGDDEHPPPETIIVGVCGVGVHCGTSKCRRAAPHVSWWEVGDPETPATQTARYRRQEVALLRDYDGELSGRAVYAIGGLMDPRNFGERARVPMGSDPLVTAGFTPATCMRGNDLLEAFAAWRSPSASRPVSSDGVRLPSGDDLADFFTGYLGGRAAARRLRERLSPDVIQGLREIQGRTRRALGDNGGGAS